MSKNIWPETGGRRRTKELALTSEDHKKDVFAKRWMKVNVWVTRYGFASVFAMILGVILVLFVFGYILFVTFTL